jgi:hypothetical protein
MPNVYTKKELEDICKSMPASSHPKWWLHNGSAGLKQERPELWRALLCEKNELPLYLASPDEMARAVVEWRYRNNR